MTARDAAASGSARGSHRQEEREPAGARLLRFGKRAAKLAFSLALTLLGLLAITFFVGRVVPVDPVLSIVGDRAPPSTYDRVYKELGLDKPLIEQFVIYAKKILSGDFGESFLTKRPVLEDLRRVFPATFELATAGLFVGVLFGVPMGVLAAARQGKLTDQILRVLCLIGYSAPIFWLGLMGLLIFYARLGWVAGPGRIDIAYEYTLQTRTGLLLIDSLLARDWGAFRSVVFHLILPACILGYFSMAYICRMTRGFMLRELSQEYVATARVKGVAEWRIVWGHALRNAAVPLITVIGLSYINLLEGSVLTETIFAWPGLGQYLTSSLQKADMNAVLGATLLTGVIFVAINLLSDLLYAALDPRARRRG